MKLTTKIFIGFSIVYFTAIAVQIVLNNRAANTYVSPEAEKTRVLDNLIDCINLSFCTEEEVYDLVKEKIEENKKKEKMAQGCYPSKNDKVNHLLEKYFKDCGTIKTMWAIAQAESGGKQVRVNKANKNGSWDCGYLQLNTIHRKSGETKEAFCDRMHDLEENIKAAARVYKEAGHKFTPWVAYNTAAHLSYTK